MGSGGQSWTAAARAVGNSRYTWQLHAQIGENVALQQLLEID